MSLARWIPIEIHAIGDYAGGLLLVLAPFLFGFSNNTPALWVSVVIGMLVILSSLITDYPASIAKILPVQLHALLEDYLGGLPLIGLPFLLYSDDWAALITHVAIGLGLLAVSLFTDYRPARREARTTAVVR